MLRFILLPFIAVALVLTSTEAAHAEVVVVRPFPVGGARHRDTGHGLSHTQHGVGLLGGRASSPIDADRELCGSQARS